MSIRLEEGVSSLTNRCKWWNDHQNIALPTLTVPLSTGGGLHWLHAQPERTWSGKGRQEEGGALRAACREGGGGDALHSLSLHCDPWPWQGPYQHWCGRLDDLSERLFFYTMVITFVIMPTENLHSLTDHLRRLFHGCSDGQKNKKVFFVCCFFLLLLFSFFMNYFFLSFTLPKHCDCICEKLHPILYLCNTDPCLSLGGSVWLIDTRGGGWWWASLVQSGGCTVNHSTGS